MKLLNKLRQFIVRKPLIVIALIILIGLFLRVYNLKDNIIFAYDQARDALRIMDIVYNHDIKLVGPETDIPGVFNGVLFYLILLPVYIVFRFDPNAVAVLMVFLNLSIIPLLFYFAAVLFNNKYVGYMAGFLWAISFEQINFAKFISNASLMTVSATLFFLGLAIYIFQKKDWGLVLSAIGYAASIHFNFYLFYLIIFYPVFFLIYKPKIRFLPILTSFITIALILSPFVVAEIRWGFPAVKGLASYFANHAKSGNGFDLLATLGKYYGRMSDLSYFSFFTTSKKTAALFMIPLIIIGFVPMEKKRRTYLLISLLSTFPLFFFNSGVLTVQVINTSIFFAVTLTVASAICLIGKRSIPVAALLILTMLISSLYLYSRNNFVNNEVFTSAPQLLGYEKRLIDQTYLVSNKNKFSICGAMNPLFTNTIWSFLYKTYGEQKYGYLPFWAGQQQFITTNYLSNDTEHVKNRFIIIEPVGVPDFAKSATVYLEDQRSKLINQKNYGEYVLQTRKLLENKDTPVDSQSLPKKESDSIMRVVHADPRYYCYSEY